MSASARSRLVVRLVQTFLSACCVAVALVFGRPADAAAAGAVDGRVTVNGAARAGVSVTLAGNGAARQTRTDAAGNFTFTGLPFGRYTVTAHLNGYRDARATIGVTGAPSRAVSLDLGEPPQIGSVTVTRGAPLGASDLSTTVITRAQIEASPEQSVDQILNRVPGVYISSIPADETHPTGAGISVRGFGASGGVQTLVLVDGIPINDGFFRTIDWNRIPKDSIERIEIVRGGGATSLWGNLALGGVINIVTRAPQAGAQRVDVAAGSYDTHVESIGSTLLATDAFKVGLNLDASSTSGYNLVPAQFRNPYQGSTSSHSDGGSLDLVFTPSGTTQAYLRAMAHSITESGLVWQLAGNRWSEYTLEGGVGHQLSAHTSFNAYAWNDTVIFDTTNASTAATNGIPYNYLTSPASGAPYVSQNEGMNYHTNGGSVVFNVHQAAVGFDDRAITALDRNVFYNQAGAATESAADTGEHKFEGLFVQDQAHAGKKLALNVGVRQDFWQAVNGNIGVTNGILNSPLQNVWYSHLDPRLGFTYAFDPIVTLRGAVYENFVAPGMNQMYRSYISGSTLFAGNAMLSPVTAAGEELGVAVTRGRFTGSVTLYHSLLQNFIDSAKVCQNASGSTKASPPYPACTASTPQLIGTSLISNLAGVSVSQNANVGVAQFQGAEVVLSERITSTTELDAGFTRTQGYLVHSSVPTDPVDSQIGGIPAYTATLGASWTMGPRFNVHVDGRTFPGYWDDTAHTAWSQPATLFDLSLAYHVTPSLDAYVHGTNITGDTYIDKGTSSTGTAPSLGPPPEVLLGLRWAHQ